jgi:hypothetical protein
VPARALLVSWFTFQGFAGDTFLFSNLCRPDPLTLPANAIATMVWYYIFLRQFVPSAAMRLPRLAVPFLSNTILDVFAHSPRPNVPWIAARWVIARMAGHLPRRKRRLIVQLPSYLRRPSAPTSNPNHATRSSVRCPQPRPTIVGATALDPFPKSLGNRHFLEAFFPSDDITDQVSPLTLLSLV